MILDRARRKLRKEKWDLNNVQDEKRAPPFLKAMVTLLTTFLNKQTLNYKVLLIFGLFSSIFSAGVSGFGGGQYVILYLTALGATPAMLGVLRSIGSAVNAIISTPMGWMMDNYNLKKLMLVGMILQYIPSLVYILAGKVGFYLWWAIPSRIINTIALGLTRSSLMLLIVKSLVEEDRATGFSIRITLSRVPSLVTPMIWAFIVTFFGGLTVPGIQPLFFISLMGRTISIIWIYFKLDVSTPEKPLILNTKRKSPMKRLQSFTNDLGDTIKAGKGVKRWILALCCDSFAFSLIMGFTTLYAVEVKDANPYILGLMGTTFTVTNLLMAIPIGRLSDKIGRKNVIYGGLPSMFCWLFLLMYAPSPIYLIISQIFNGIFRTTFPVWNIITMELVPESYRGRFLGVTRLFTSLVSVPGSFLAGFIWTLFDPKLLFFMALAFESAAIILIKMTPVTRAQLTGMAEKARSVDSPRFDNNMHNSNH